MLEELKIIQPAHHNIAKNVESWKEIKECATDLRKFIQGGSFRGNYPSAFSLSHWYVSTEPWNFFVINEKIKNGELAKAFGSWVIINPKITSFSDPVYWKEACMAFPFRAPKNTDRMNKITVEYQIPFLFGSLRTIKKEFSNINAFIVQHEVEHCSGKNIFKK